MIKGKIYKEIDSTHALVVMCTHCYTENFTGVILGSDQFNLIGIVSPLFKINKFTEYIGPYSINNVLIDYNITLTDKKYD